MAETLVHIDDALAFLIKKLTELPPIDLHNGRNANNRPYGSDIWIAGIVPGFALEHLGIAQGDFSFHTHEHVYRIFYDAAWELCRRNVLRPGRVSAAGQGGGADFSGDGYALTAYGREWIKKYPATELIPTDPGRLSMLFAKFSSLFGKGFLQRANEAAASYRSLNYLSCCVMCGAAVESILLATAVATADNEAAILKTYRGAAGRSRVINIIVGTLKPTLAEQFKRGTELLSYWRDEAGHGLSSEISEIEAHEALTRLLRFAQFVEDNWAELTSSKS